MPAAHSTQGQSQHLQRSSTSLCKLCFLLAGAQGPIPAGPNSSWLRLPSCSQYIPGLVPAWAQCTWLHRRSREHCIKPPNSSSKLGRRLLCCKQSTCFVAKQLVLERKSHTVPAQQWNRAIGSLGRLSGAEPALLQAQSTQTHALCWHYGGGCIWDRRCHAMTPLLPQGRGDAGPRHPEEPEPGD